MYLDSAKKKEFFASFGANEKDTGSAEAQIAMFSYRIAHLTEHLKQNRKDFHTQRALIKLVSVGSCWITSKQKTLPATAKLFQNSVCVVNDKFTNGGGNRYHTIAFFVFCVFTQRGGMP